MTTLDVVWDTITTADLVRYAVILLTRQSSARNKGRVSRTNVPYDPCVVKYQKVTETEKLRSETCLKK